MVPPTKKFRFGLRSVLLLTAVLALGMALYKYRADRLPLQWQAYSEERVRESLDV